MKGLAIICFQMRKLRFEETIDLPKEREPGDNRAGTWTQASQLVSNLLIKQLNIFSYIRTTNKQTNTKNGFPHWNVDHQ